MFILGIRSLALLQSYGIDLDNKVFITFFLLLGRVYIHVSDSCLHGVLHFSIPTYFVGENSYPTTTHPR
jgi:hypothetical protein